MFKKISDTKLFKWIRYVREQLQNQRENRQQIGIDREGNKYYQYYSYWGLPTRRQIRFKDPNGITMTDLVYYRWLYNQQFNPPTQTQKAQFYLQQKIRYQKALQWDMKQQKLIDQFKRKKLQIQHRNKELLQLQKVLQQKKQLDIKSKRANEQKHI